MFQLGIFVVHFLDYTIGCCWWLMVLYLLEILAVFVVRGRPYSGETVVATMFSHSAGCLQAWAAPLLIFTWNVILPVALVVRCCINTEMRKNTHCCTEWKHRLSCWQVICIMVFKNGQFRDLYNWHSITYNYWPVWTREVGCMLQILPIILVPFVCIVQTCRYLSIGPPDILDVSVGDFNSLFAFFHLFWIFLWFLFFFFLLLFSSSEHSVTSTELQFRFLLL